MTGQRIVLGGTLYEFVEGSLEILGGRDEVILWGKSWKGCWNRLAILKKVPGNTGGNVEDLQFFIPQNTTCSKRSEYSYITEIIEKSLALGDLSTALAAVKDLSNYTIKE